MSNHPGNKSGQSQGNMLFPPLAEYTKFPRTGQPANYEERAELMMIEMMQEQLYDRCALLIAEQGNPGEYLTPNDELSIELFVRELVGRVAEREPLA